jgi:hypothetical protein
MGYQTMDDETAKIIFESFYRLLATMHGDPPQSAALSFYAGSFMGQILHALEQYNKEKEREALEPKFDNSNIKPKSEGE